MRGNVIPFIGQGLSMAAVPNMPSKDVLLRELASSLPINEQVRKTIEILLDLELENKSAEVLALLSRDSEIDLYRQLKAILNPLVDKYRPSSVPHRILDALNLRFYITTNYDRVLEQLLTYPYEVVTSSDTSALRYVMGDPNSRFILKLYGDISRPETILQSEHMLNEIRAKNGNNLSSEAQVLFDVLKQVFHNHTVLFLGSSLKDRSGLYGLVTLFASLWGPPRRRHMALVPQDLTRTRIREKIAEELGIQTLEYVPDAVHSQMWEFLLYLDNSKESEPIPGDTWSRFFRPQEHSAYLKLLLALEQRAREVRIVTPTLTNMISTYEYVDTVIKQEFLRKAQAEDLAVEERLVNENLVSLMRHRRDNLEARLYQDLVAVRVLFLQSEFDRSLNQAEDVRLRLIINRYQYMLRLIEETDLEVRLIPTLTTEEFRAIVTSTEIIIGTQPTPHGDISIAQAVQGTAAFFEALVIQTNTEEVNSNLVEFERLWGTAWSRKATLSYIRRALDHRLRMLG
ncbi:MAG TPA: SIR2 family protein [Herpetosiphonaceae bacterium]|nr:SIR2 family protein [Herpetosiphonaceae bacterium]